MIREKTKKEHSRTFKMMDALSSKQEKDLKSANNLEVLNESNILSNISKNRQRRFLNARKQRQEDAKAISIKLSKGLTDIILESYVFDFNKKDLIEVDSRNNVQTFIEGLFEKGIIKNEEGKKSTSPSSIEMSFDDTFLYIKSKNIKTKIITVKEK
jgi:hypothetical protein